MGKRLLILLTLSMLLPVAQVRGAETVTQTVSAKTVFSFAGGAVKFVVIPSGGSATVTIQFNEIGVNQGGPTSPKTLLHSINLSATCITLTGSNQCPVFNATVNSGSLTPPIEVRIVYATDNAFNLNPRVCRFEAAGIGNCGLTEYFPFVPAGAGDPTLSGDSGGGLSTWFAATETISASEPGVATILDPVANTTMANPRTVNGGNTVPLKVLLCHTPTLDPCSPIFDAVILVSIARVDPDFAIVVPLNIPGSSTPPPTMTPPNPLSCSGSTCFYQLNWTVPVTPGLYEIIFTFLTSNSNVLNAWVRVPSP